MAEEDSCITQLIDDNGEFNVAGLGTFTRTVKFSELGISYAVVAIIGPQSSGKSTLLNNLFHTDFREMDAFRGRSQTTKGIWIARAVGIAPCTVIMDVEGSDGKERGKEAYMKELADAYKPGGVLSHVVGVAAGLGISLAGVAGGPAIFAGATAVGSQVYKKVTSAVASALGVPDAADTEVIRRRNQDMLAESD